MFQICYVHYEKKKFLKKIRKWVSYNGETHSKLPLICISLRLDSTEKYCVCVSSFLILSFFFFLRRAFHVHCGSHTGRESKIMFLQWVSCTIHGTHKYFIKKSTLKLNPTVLFTYLKIIFSS